MSKIDLSVIDRQHEAAMAANELKKHMDTNRPEVERAIAKVLRDRGLPRNYAGELVHNGYTIRIQRRTVIQFLGEKNDVA